MNLFSNNKQSSTETLILGLGNEILTDDGIGPKIVQLLWNYPKYKKFMFATASCGGLELVEAISGFNHVIVIDAIRTKNGVPGEVYLFSPDDFKETLHLSSFHDVSFLIGLKLAANLDISIPSKISILAIEIIEDLVFSDQLSPILRTKFPKIVKIVETKITHLLL